MLLNVLPRLGKLQKPTFFYSETVQQSALSRLNSSIARKLAQEQIIKKLRIDTPGSSRYVFLLPFGRLFG